MGNSKLTEKYQAGRGRALKEFSRRSPKAEVFNINCSCMLVLSFILETP